MKGLNPKFVDEDGHLCLSGVHKDLLLQFIEILDPVVVKTDEYWRKPGNGTGAIEQAHVFTRSEAEDLIGLWNPDAQIISIFDL